ncbi:MAG: SIMPL domain-containing protein [Niabella sp.]
MKKILTIAAILFSISVYAQVEKNFIDKNYIEVTCKAEMEFTPDKIYIQVLLSEIGLSNAGIEKLESSKIGAYRQEVKINAIKAAKEKAALLCESIGQKAGKALYIQEQNVFANPVCANTMMYEAKARTIAEAADLNFENLKVEATVMTRFEIL